MAFGCGPSHIWLHITLEVRDHTAWFWRCVETTFGHFLLGSQNFRITTLGSCVTWPWACEVEDEVEGIDKIGGEVYGGVEWGMWRGFWRHNVVIYCRMSSIKCVAKFPHWGRSLWKVVDVLWFLNVFLSHNIIQIHNNVMWDWRYSTYVIPILWLIMIKCVISCSTIIIITSM